MHRIGLLHAHLQQHLQVHGLSQFGERAQNPRTNHHFITDVVVQRAQRFQHHRNAPGVVYIIRRLPFVFSNLPLNFLAHKPLSRALIKLIRHGNPR